MHPSHKSIQKKEERLEEALHAVGKSTQQAEFSIGRVITCVLHHPALLHSLEGVLRRDRPLR
jgi:hypothetical protein